VPLALRRAGSLAERGGAVGASEGGVIAGTWWSAALGRAGSLAERNREVLV